MLNLGQLVATVQKNCHISDARHAGNYSMCIFLLKMREYYRWEHELPYSSELSKDEIGEWLVEREQVWEQLEDERYEPLPLGDKRTDPFDADSINRELVELGYVYSSGYGLFNKPHFFLGELSRKEEREGVTILISSCEYARDLVAPPAMTLGDTVFIRQESVRRFLWEKIEEWHWTKKKDGPMARAVEYCGNDEDIEAVLDTMTEQEIEVMILHEIGEVRAGEMLGADWEQLLSEIPRSKAELIIRAVRDNLADCLATLPALIDAGDHGSLHLYFANFFGMRKHLFPELMQAYEQWVSSGRIEPLAKAAADGGKHWLTTAQTILTLYRKHDLDAGPAIERLLDPEAA